MRKQYIKNKVACIQNNSFVQLIKMLPKNSPGQTVTAGIDGDKIITPNTSVINICSDMLMNMLALLPQGAKIDSIIHSWSFYGLFNNVDKSNYYDKLLTDACYNSQFDYEHVINGTIEEKEKFLDSHGYDWIVVTDKINFKSFSGEPVESPVAVILLYALAA